MSWRLFILICKSAKFAHLFLILLPTGLIVFVFIACSLFKGSIPFLLVRGSIAIVIVCAEVILPEIDINSSLDSEYKFPQTLNLALILWLAVFQNESRCHIEVYSFGAKTAVDAMPEKVEIILYFGSIKDCALYPFDGVFVEFEEACRHSTNQPVISWSVLLTMGCRITVLNDKYFLLL